MRIGRNIRNREEAKRGPGIKILITLLVIAAAVTASAFVGWKMFVLKKVDVIGNVIYSDEQIENWVLSDEYSWNTLYVVFRNRFQQKEEIPFVDSMEVRMVSPSEVEVEVSEKGMLGYLYVPSLGRNAYFDRDGFVVEISGESVDGVTKISGLEVEYAGLYEKLELEDGGILKTMLSLTQILDKYGIRPEVVYVEDDQILLSYGDIQVNLGVGTQLNEKILRLTQILPKISGMTGTLHLDAWSDADSDIYFVPGELTAIPEDRQTLSAISVLAETEEVENLTAEDAGFDAEYASEGESADGGESSGYGAEDDYGSYGDLYDSADYYDSAVYYDTAVYGDGSDSSGYDDYGYDDYGYDDYGYDDYGYDDYGYDDYGYDDYGYDTYGYDDYGYDSYDDYSYDDYYDDYGYDSYGYGDSYDYGDSYYDEYAYY